MAAILRVDDQIPIKLPLEILITEILLRLPVKSLLRLKCVCKFFKTLISSSEFINLHLRHSQSLSSDSNRFLIFIRNRRRGLFSVALDSPESGGVNVPIPRSLKRINPIVIGSCNGLLCILICSYEDYRLCLLNPSIGIYREILLRCKDGSKASNFGFGFDCETDDYKIVAFVNIFDSDDRPNYRRNVMVYSLKGDKWGLVETTSNPQDSVLGSGALINNHLLHWRFWCKTAHKQRIGCFDLRTEQWGDDVPLPDDCRVEDAATNYDIRLGVLHGCLFLSMEYFYEHKGPAVDVWIMKEYGVKESWVKLLSILNPWPPEFLPLVYRPGSRKSEVLVWQGSKMFWYNVRDKIIKVAEIHGLPPCWGVRICTGSLVPLAGGRTILDLVQQSNPVHKEGSIPRLNLFSVVSYAAYANFPSSSRKLTGSPGSLCDNSHHMQSTQGEFYLGSSVPLALRNASPSFSQTFISPALRPQRDDPGPSYSDQLGFSEAGSSHS